MLGQMRYCRLAVLLALAHLGLGYGPSDTRMESQLTVHTDIPHAQVEVGGPYAGIEAHHSSPLLTRISFFYPVANSLDNSEDYWTRDTSRVFLIALKEGDNKPQLLETGQRLISLTPYSVSYRHEATSWEAEVSYEFCLGEPALLATITLKNKSARTEQFDLRTHLDAALRTSHTYERKEKAWTELDARERALLVHHLDPETGPAELIVVNVGAEPHSFATDGRDIATTLAPPPSRWLTEIDSLPCTLLPEANPGPPVVAFIYRAQLRPEEAITVKQLVGICAAGEGRALAQHLRRTYEREVAAYRAHVLQESFRGTALRIQEPGALHTARWARGVLAANAHYLAGHILPMPCPAEYNFFFTHDALLTDVAACRFNPARVRRDLLYLASLKDSLNTLPHAYYWKDHRYVTELAGPDNWNHLWFIIVAGRYFKHSADRRTMAELLPLLTRSLHLVLTNCGEDDLVWAYRPDWWDIGSNYGPRAYMTILTVAAMREFIHLSWGLGQKDSLMRYEQLSTRMERALKERLWDDERGYLMDYLQDGKPDPHLYTGPLLAVPFGLLDGAKAERLVATARRVLVDQNIGVLNAYPPDFDQLVEEFRFHGNEAGTPYHYLNGGVWPHGNAWYALALNAVGAKQEAYDFLAKTMSLHGVMTSPNGQPAMYEYRCGDPSDSLRYGQVDKPQFLWAAAWYLEALLSVYGLTGNAWNLSIDPFLPLGQSEFASDWFVAGNKVLVSIRGQGPVIRRLRFDGHDYPSAVIPHKSAPRRRVNVELGRPQHPYLAAANSALVSARWEERGGRLELLLAAFPRHRSAVVVISPWPLVKASLASGGWLHWDCEPVAGAHRVTVVFAHQEEEEQLVLSFGRNCSE
ncbi:MAG: hypothetical protein QHJ34_04780 [bacterium]|nr:hypothetical protein [candidate division KSB1 bacterium]MDH7559533.1 hypothetical protein [bacterium]